MKVLVQSTFEEPRDDASVRREPLVVHQRTRQTHNQALIIFVHGLGGSRHGKKGTWGQFPALVYNDFPTLDVGLYKYGTLWERFAFWKSVSLDEEAEVLGGILRIATEYKTILLAGHSMGGLLCMAAIRWLDNIEDSSTLSRIGGLLLMATPQTGSQRVPTFLSWFSRDFYALRLHGAFVTAIHRDFVNHFVVDENVTAPGKVKILAWALLGDSDFWVDKLSALSNSRQPEDDGPRLAYRNCETT